MHILIESESPFTDNEYQLIIRCNQRVFLRHMHASIQLPIAIYLNAIITIMSSKEKCLCPCRSILGSALEFELVYILLC